MEGPVGGASRGAVGGNEFLTLSLHVDEGLKHMQTWGDNNANRIKRQKQQRTRDKRRAKKAFAFLFLSKRKIRTKSGVRSNVQSDAPDMETASDLIEGPGDVAPCREKKRNLAVEGL